MFKKLSKLKTHHQIIFATIIAFAVICFWRGTWGLLDLYLLPGNPLWSYWISVALGLFVLVATGYVTKELM